MQRVLVLPQQPEFRPGGHSPLHHPQPPPHAHLPAFIPHPAMMPLPPHLYTGIAGGVGDMSSQYTSQYHPAHIYSEQGEFEPLVSGLRCLSISIHLHGRILQSSLNQAVLFFSLNLSGSLCDYCPHNLYAFFIIICDIPSF